MNVPLNITKYYQPLEWTVNGYVKHFMERKFDDWCSNRITDQLDSGASLEDVKVSYVYHFWNQYAQDW